MLPYVTTHVATENIIFKAFLPIFQSVDIFILAKHLLQVLPVFDFLLEIDV